MICYKCGQAIDETKSYSKVPVDPTQVIRDEEGNILNESEIEWKYKHSPKCPVISN